MAQGSESDPDTKHRPPSFPNHYVNGDVRNSWHRRERSAAVAGAAAAAMSSPYNAYSYTDSEVDSSQYATSMNGGHVIMNNMAGSRAPLPGYSSFVWTATAVVLYSSVCDISALYATYTMHFLFM